MSDNYTFIEEGNMVPCKEDLRTSSCLQVFVFISQKKETELLYANQP
jgi:hypothetical protein